MIAQQESAVTVPQRILDDLAHWMSDADISKVTVNVHDNRVKVEYTSYDQYTLSH